MASFNPAPAWIRKHLRREDQEQGAQGRARDQGSFLLAGIILIIASAMLIANTIRLSIFARRREIEADEARRGASNWFVRGPFVLDGIASGSTGRCWPCSCSWSARSSRCRNHPFVGCRDGVHGGLPAGHGEAILILPGSHSRRGGLCCRFAASSLQILAPALPSSLPPGKAQSARPGAVPRTPGSLRDC